MSRVRACVRAHTRACTSVHTGRFTCMQPQALFLGHGPSFMRDGPSLPLALLLLRKQGCQAASHGEPSASTPLMLQLQAPGTTAGIFSCGFQELNLGLHACKISTETESSPRLQCLVTDLVLYDLPVIQ